MIKVGLPVLPRDEKKLPSALQDILKKHATAINDYHEATAKPTTGSWARGDFVWNSEPSEAGSASSKYVVLGWTCTVGGTPGTWLDARVLTGN